MKLKKVTMSLACAISFAGTMFGATLDGVQTSVIPGEWTSSYSAARSYAEENGVPMLVFWSSPGCAKCNKMKASCNTEEFVAWRKARKIILVFSEGDETVKSFARNSSGKFPYMRLYWPKGGIDSKFTGRSDTIPATGSTLQAKLMNYVDDNIKAWISGGGDAGAGTVIASEQPSTPTAADLSAWKKARYLSGSYYTSDGTLAGRILVTAGKVNARGNAKVKAKVMGFDGRAKSFGSKSVTVGTVTSGTVSNNEGSYAFSIVGSTISGKLTRNGITYDVRSVGTGGSQEDGVYTFALESYPTVCESFPVIKGTAYLPLAQKFSVSSSRWSFASKGALKYDNKSNAFFMSATDNPSGLKLSYKGATGFFKGTFTVYAARNVKYVKRYAAKVTGFMIGNSGEGEAVIRNVGTYKCKISK